ncbi:TPA: type 1 fimbrial protein [Salmonella enterica]|nr:type 1 fimbrial protein [Salmonella enterica]
MNMKKIKTAILLAGMAGSPWAMAYTLDTSPSGGTGDVSFDYTMKTGACRVSAPDKSAVFLDSTVISGDGIHDKPESTAPHDVTFHLTDCKNINVNLTLSVVKGQLNPPIPPSFNIPADKGDRIGFVYPDGNVHTGELVPYFIVQAYQTEVGTHDIFVNTPYVIKVNSDNYKFGLRFSGRIPHDTEAHLMNGTYTAGLTYTFSYQ